jgi:hypothetical protein
MIFEDREKRTCSVLKNSLRRGFYHITSEVVKGKTHSINCISAMIMVGWARRLRKFKKGEKKQ